MTKFAKSMLDSLSITEIQLIMRKLKMIKTGKNRRYLRLLEARLADLAKKPSPPKTK
jgi:hypothetical protein